MTVLGIDLGVRSVHVSSESGTTTYAVEKTHRSEEITGLVEAFKRDYPAWRGYIEEPVVAGARNLRTTIQIAQLCGALLATGDAHLVPVAVWKKEIVGKGNASKDDVRAWYEREFPHLLPQPNQDHIDATCIRLYAEKIIGIADRLTTDR